jgi:hypothetical protein
MLSLFVDIQVTQDVIILCVYLPVPQDVFIVCFLPVTQDVNKHSIIASCVTDK